VVVVSEVVSFSLSDESGFVTFEQVGRARKHPRVQKVCEHARSRFGVSSLMAMYSCVLRTLFVACAFAFDVVFIQVSSID